MTTGTIRNFRPFFGHLVWLVVMVLAGVLAHGNLVAQSADTVAFKPARAWLVGSSGAAIGAGTIVGLSVLWYKDHDRSQFHLFNDNGDWLQMDKAGHAMTAYYMGHMGIRALQWTGTERKKAVWIGGLYGFTYLTAIEVLDSFSDEYGFSVGDVASNGMGAAMAIGQELLWREQRMFLKFSAQYSPYAQYRPEVLGSEPLERLLKDYNGQTYWLSVNASAWFREKPDWLPAWLNIAAGYGVDGLTGGTSNPAFNHEGEPLPFFQRQRQLYLSIDVDLTRIKTRSKVLRTCFDLLSFVKIPAPAIEINQQGTVRGHWIYF